MRLIKVFLFVLSLALVCSQDAGVLFDLNGMYEQGTLQAFLALGDDGYPVTLGECLDSPTFKIVQKGVVPSKLIKGQSIKILVAGVMTQDVVVQKIHLDTYFNGNVIYTAEVDKKNVEVKKGKWNYDYEASVPTFTPNGDWIIKVFVVDKNNANLSCIQAAFSTK